MQLIELENSELKVLVDDDDYKWLMLLGSWRLHSNKLHAYLKRIGYYNTELLAALAFNQKSLEIFGKEAVLNKIN